MRFFLGASFLTAALVVPQAGPWPVAAGIALAASLRWALSRIPRSAA